ncbi:hypothetical protein RRG08_035575 [Elysia crispata]|uniref:Uncharacterized protein n=1 Tax=Elysia crispata TaxID=231223 RepID=A0AAE1B502_9GAST|nr:hypothetical protein RRG08_035575 [Elysia crispata]
MPPLGPRDILIGKNFSLVTRSCTENNRAAAISETSQRNESSRISIASWHTNRQGNSSLTKERLETRLAWSCTENNRGEYDPLTGLSFTHQLSSKCRLTTQPILYVKGNSGKGRRPIEK